MLKLQLKTFVELFPRTVHNNLKTLTETTTFFEGNSRDVLFCWLYTEGFKPNSCYSIVSHNEVVCLVRVG